MAYSFEELSTQYISANINPTVAVYPSTLSAWAYPTADLSRGLLTAYAATTSQFDHFRIQLAGATAGDPANALIRVNNVNNIALSPTPPGFVLNAWNHVCGVFTSSTSRTIYLNGRSNTVTPATNSLIADSVFIGAFITIAGVANNTFQGYISETAIWSQALDPSEVESLNKGFSPKKVRPQSLEFYVPLIRNLQEYMTKTTLTNNNSATIISHSRTYS